MLQFASTRWRKEVETPSLLLAKVNLNPCRAGLLPTSCVFAASDRNSFIQSSDELAAVTAKILGEGYSAPSFAELLPKLSRV